MAKIVPVSKAASVNPLKSSQPLGAAFAYLGVDGAVPLFHGSQGLHVLRAGPVRPPLQGDDPAPDHGDGRGRDHPRRRRPSRGGDPQSEGPRQAEADRHRHHGARRDARRGLWRRARRHQAAPGRGTRRDGARARPDARFRRRDRGGLVEGGRRDDRVDRPSGGSRSPQCAAGQYSAGLASHRRRRRAHPFDGRGFRPRAGHLPRHFRRARRDGAGELGSHDLWRNVDRRHPLARRRRSHHRDRRADARAGPAHRGADRRRIRALPTALWPEGGRPLRLPA